MSSNNFPTVSVTAENAPDCLRSLYGAGNAKRVAKAQSQLDERETRRKNTAKSLSCPGAREQEIYTPLAIVAAIKRMWPLIALDPCSGPRSVVGAERCYSVSPSIVPMLDAKGNARLDKEGNIKTKVVYVPLAGETDGKAARWEDYTYCNPPFKFLKDWMMKARHEGEDGLEVLLLAPSRAHRKWFRDVAATATSICDLDPVKFMGFKSAFPGPMQMLYWGQLKNLFKHEFHGILGDCR